MGQSGSFDLESYTVRLSWQRLTPQTSARIFRNWDPNLYRMPTLKELRRNAIHTYTIRDLDADPPIDLLPPIQYDLRQAGGLAA